MSDMVKSSSEISIAAEAKVMSELEVRAKQHRVIARECLSPTTEPVQIEVHKFAAELYDELIKAAPGAFNERAKRLAAAENAMKEADDAV
jgi:hypothetical protein